MSKLSKLRRAGRERITRLGSPTLADSAADHPIVLPPSMSSSKKSPDAQARAASPNEPPIWPRGSVGLVPTGEAPKVSPEVAEELRALGIEVPLDRIARR